jgi:putative DNA methylase
MACVAEVNGKRCYFDPIEAGEWADAEPTRPDWLEQRLPENARWFSPPLYGLTHYTDLFTNRHLLALTTIRDTIVSVCRAVEKECGDAKYAEALATYLACALSRLTDYCCGLATWNPTNENVSHLFQRQAIPMIWDCAEVNPFQGRLSFEVAADWVASSLQNVAAKAQPARVAQLDATDPRMAFDSPPVISTDPPYYDNIGYADLSDFFYVWLRSVLVEYQPSTFATLLTPKTAELIASPYKHDGSSERAEDHFRKGFASVFDKLRVYGNREVPATVYYAFKQEDSEVDDADERISTGWETMLEGLVEAGFQITATWPVRTTKKARSVARRTNAHASAIVLAIRQRPDDAPVATRRGFLSALRSEMRVALSQLTSANIAPVDLAQAAIGPGMSVFSRFSRVVEADDRPIMVKDALGIINQVVDEIQTEEESEFDPDTRWALTWFEQRQFDEGPYGEAEVLATAKALSVQHLAEAGILHSRAGKVRLLRREELSENWDPSAIGRLTIWEVTQHLIRSLDQKGEQETANLKAKIGGMAEIARDLAYRLYTLCERKGWAEEAGYYNSLVVAWPSMTSEAFELN